MTGTTVLRVAGEWHVFTGRDLTETIEVYRRYRWHYFGHGRRLTTARLKGAEVTRHG